ncbi:MAG: haloacid dehalogenase-like hydrolase [Rickettsiales bacterium]|jgi:phosphoserine phosphatase|nr:haloacid dehalogenase-like hydrolase [Rickettsiales bacterium]
MKDEVRVVLFDFDGTLSAGDANSGFWKYCFAHSLRPWFFLPIVLFGFLIKPFNKGGVFWRQCARCFLTPDMVKKLAPGFIKLHRKKRFAWAKDTIAREKEWGRLAICISAGPDYLILPLVKDMGFDLIICTETDKRRPWKLKFLCWGINKVIALTAWEVKNNIRARVIKSFSDHPSDAPMMGIADVCIWVNPKTGEFRNI